MSSQAEQALRPAEVPAGTWIVDGPASSAQFTVRDKLVTTVRGSFPVAGGTVVTDAGGHVVGARLELAAAGVTTGNDHRDRDLLTPRFLDAADHPTIVVEAGSTEPTTSGWTVDARLSARGSSCPVTLEVIPTATAAGCVEVHVGGRLDRTGLGMRVPTFIVGRHVDVDVDLVLVMHES